MRTEGGTRERVRYQTRKDLVGIKGSTHSTRAQRIIACAVSADMMKWLKGSAHQKPMALVQAGANEERFPYNSRGWPKGSYHYNYRL